MRFHDIDQGSDAWFELRRGKLTASIYKTCFSSQSTLTFKNLISSKVDELITGIVVKTFESFWMTRGNELEPEAREEYENETLQIVKNGGFFEYNDYIGDSPDGLIGDDGVLEIKCPKASTMDKWIKQNKLPTAYKWQVYGHLLCTGRKWCDFVAYHPSYELFIIKVYRDEKIIEKLLNQLLLTVKIIKNERDKSKSVSKRS